MMAHLGLVLVVCPWISAADPQTSTPPSASTTVQIARTPKAVFGVNLGRVCDWSLEIPFADAFKTSRPWIEQGPGPFTFDNRGSPLLRPDQTVQSVMYRGLGGRYPAGTYVATFEGTGAIDIQSGDVEQGTEKSSGRLSFRVRPGNEGIPLLVGESSPRDPIRNIRVWMPGTEHSRQAFHPDFLQRVEPFGIVRFKNWQRTDGSPIVTWSQRSSVEDARWSGDAGVPIETMCELANTVRAIPWFCIPHGADDDFVRNFAKLVKDRVDARLPIYVEYSHEMWNLGLPQAQYAAERGKKLQLGAPDYLRFYARRSVEVLDICSSIIEPNRLVRVLSGPFNTPSDCDAILKFQDAARHADVFAVAALFGQELGSPKSCEATLKLSPEQVIDQLSQEVDGKHRDLMRRQARLSTKYGLRLLSYSSGPNLIGQSSASTNEKVTELFLAVNRHPRMADLYRKHIDNWVQEGGSGYVASEFVGLPGKSSAGGLLEFQDQPVEQAHKYRVIKELSLEAKSDGLKAKDK